MYTVFYLIISFLNFYNWYIFVFLLFKFISNILLFLSNCSDSSRLLLLFVSKYLKNIINSSFDWLKLIYLYLNLFEFFYLLAKALLIRMIMINLLVLVFTIWVLYLMYLLFLIYSIFYFYLKIVFFKLSLLIISITDNSLSNSIQYFLW